MDIAWPSLMRALGGALLDSLAQAFLVVGILAVLTAAHGALERASRTLLTRSFGWWSVLWTGWIGVPIHEMSHLVACLAFRHRIRALSLFSPDPRTGNLGYVDHTWDPRSRFQRAGNFAVGIAPVVGGAAVMAATIHLALPSRDAVEAVCLSAAGFLSSPSTATGAALVRRLLVDLPAAILAPQALSSWKLWVALYVLMAVGLHMSPSRDDLAGSWKGFAWIIAAICAGNLLALPFGGMPGVAVAAAARVVAPAAMALLVALVLNAAALGVVLAITSLARTLARPARRCGPAKAGSGSTA